MQQSFWLTFLQSRERETITTFLGVGEKQEAITAVGAIILSLWLLLPSEAIFLEAIIPGIYHLTLTLQVL